MAVKVISRDSTTGALAAGNNDELLVFSEDGEVSISSDTLVVTDGAADVDGTLSAIHLTAETKSFLIKHPTKEGMKLRYGSLEGPENGVYVRGRSRSRVIELPDYWVGLVDESTITVQLTPAGRRQNLYVKSTKDNMVIVGGGWFGVDFHYVVFAERKDVAKLKVEE